MSARWRAGFAVVGAALAVVACGPSERRPGAVADSLMAPGESLYVRGAYDSAASSWNALLGRPGIAGSATEAKLLHGLGLAAWRRGDYSEARRLGERALALKRELSLSRGEVAESQNALGLLAWNEGRLGEAGALLTEALRGFESEGDRAGVAKASNNLALVSLELGRFDEAREGFEQARAAASATGNQRTAGRATTNLAMIAIWAGDPNDALPLLATSRRLADSASDPVGLANALGQAAVALNTLGEPGRALATLDSATEVARRHQLRDEEANNLLVAASIYRDAGDADRAIRLYDEARTINEALDLAVEAGMVLRHAAELRASRGALERARADATEALAIHRSAGARLEEFHDLLALSRIEDEAGGANAAARRLVEARRVIAEVDAPQTRTALALGEARLAERRGDFNAALAAIAVASPEMAASGSSAVVEAEWRRTRAFSGLGRLDSAVAAGRRAVAAIERARGGFASPVLRASVLSARSVVFADLVIALLRLGQDEEAFAIADASRGRELLEHLSNAREAARRGPTGRDLAERDRLLRRIDALLGRLEGVQARPRGDRGVDDGATEKELAERLSTARAEYEAVLLRIAERDSLRASMLGAHPVSPIAVRLALGEGEALLQYFVAPDRLVVFLATAGGVKPVQVPLSAAELENRVRLARSLIAESRSPDAATLVLEELHRTLIGPIEDVLARQGVHRLVVVPHGILAWLPFAALRNPATGRRLVEDLSIQYLPTAAALPAIRSRTRPDAVSHGRTTAFTPFTTELRATRAEGEAVANAMPRGRLITNGSATERAVRQALAAGELVHVATHGIMNPVNPMFSSVRLARGGGVSADDDGRLEVHELMGMTTASALVFLSGCETALGGARTTPFDRHEEYATLAQAFLHAGAGAVVATLWRIDDEGAARFAERFYQHLASSSAAEALAAAQRDLMGDPRWGHPWYWAGYTIAGDGPAAPGANASARAVSR